MRVIPLGGLGEIGKNMLALECDDDIIIIDAGVMFPEEDMPGVDLVIPDISYLLERQEKVRAILITHGHEDHTGALPYILPRLNVPVYAPRLAHGLIQVKLREHHLQNKVQLHEIAPGEPISLGAFEVEFFRVCHSIPDAMGLAIQTPLGLVVHTGDFKIDHTPVDGNPTDFTRLANLGQEGVFLLLSDSTYVELAGYTPSEKAVGEALDHIIGEAQGRVLVATFASLISRVQQVINAAHHHSRVVAVSGRSMVDNVNMAIKMGYLSAPEGSLLPLNEIRGRPPQEVVIVTTGTQGEPTSSLVRISNREHREIEVLPNDTIIMSASPIPGNETVINRTIDNLCRQGAQVLYSRNALVHVHGHASLEELKLMLRMTTPTYFVPVHGEYRHLLTHAELARSLGVAPENAFALEDGVVLELTAERGRIAERFPCGHIFVEGQELWDPQSQVFRDRRRLSQDGVVLVVLTVDKQDGTLLRNPELVASGFMDAGRREGILAQGSLALMESLDHRRGDPSQRDAIRASIKETLGKFLYNETKRRPMILPVVVEV